MRFYIKVFVAAFLCFALLIGGGLYFFIRPGSANGAETDKQEEGIMGLFSKKAEITPEDRLSLERMVKKSNRVNVLMMGNDGGRSDTMMLVSYDPDLKLVDIISVPRDTYYQPPGKSPMKLNAVFGLKGDKGGPASTAKVVSELLGIPVDYYVSVDYKAVSEVVDIIGGVEVTIPRRMKYDDPYDKPPLHIDLPAGKQVLNGDQAIQFLRWRKNNDGSGGAEGDLGRIERQQAFVKTAIKKALGLKLPLIIPTAFKYVKTDMPVGEMVKQGTSMIGMDMTKLRSYRIPGEAKTIKGASYYLHYPTATEAVMLAVYNRTGDETAVEGTLTKLEDVVDPSQVIKDSKKTVVQPEPEDEKPASKPEATDDDQAAPAEGDTAEETGDGTPPDDNAAVPDPTFPTGNDITPDDFIDPTHVDDTSLEDILGEPVPESQTPESVMPIQ